MFCSQELKALKKQELESKREEARRAEAAQKEMKENQKQEELLKRKKAQADLQVGWGVCVTTILTVLVCAL